MNMKGVGKECYEQLYAHKFDNLDKMGQILKRYKPLKLTHKEIDSINRPIYIKEIGSMTNNFPKQKALGLDGFTG